ncbi:MAG: acetylglutamate kinase [Bacteroidales bacterium]|nr:acetylglutamate kinase [Bacteroidales bacterium]MCF8328111.1 acetylglutamate kinase [Bacteroidales bacterium]
MQRILIKYGGNAMIEDDLRSKIIENIIQLKEQGTQVLLVHGGGPFIAEELEKAGIESEFIDGHRKTTSEALVHVEMALKGRVNGRLISLFNQFGSRAVGLSGKDAAMVMAEERVHTTTDKNGNKQKVSLGHVGDVKNINTQFAEMLLQENITPVITCIATDEKGNDYNINADMMAGHLAGALNVDHFLVLTNIDGLRHDVDDPESHITELTAEQAKGMFGNSIQGGMIPKIEACLLALEKGAHKATIINGTKPELLIHKIIHNQNVGTSIISKH